MKIFIIWLYEICVSKKWRENDQEMKWRMNCERMWCENEENIRRENANEMRRRSRSMKKADTMSDIHVCEREEKVESLYIEREREEWRQTMKW